MVGPAFIFVGSVVALAFFPWTQEVGSRSDRPDDCFCSLWFGSCSEESEVEEGPAVSDVGSAVFLAYPRLSGLLSGECAWCCAANVPEAPHGFASSV